MSLNNRWHLNFCMAMTLAGLSGVALANPAITNGLVAAYEFSGNANDSSGAGHNGSVVNATLTKDRFGNAASAYAFDGNGDYINAGNLLTGLSDFTLAAWVKVSDYTNGSYMGIFGQQPLNYPYSPDLWVFYTGSSAAFGTAGFWNDGSFVDSRVQRTLPLDTWHFITQTYDGTALRQYDNGQLVSSLAAAGKSVGNPYDFLIGRVAAYPGALQITDFAGSLDDVLIYNRALSAAEISQLAAATGSVPEPAPAVLLGLAGILVLRKRLPRA